MALVGHTGAGKSSIAKLITRFYEFQEGRILVDDQDIRTFDLQSYRRRLGIVSQSPFLFAGTVADNIRYAVPGLSDADPNRYNHPFTIAHTYPVPHSDTLAHHPARTARADLRRPDEQQWWM